MKVKDLIEKLQACNPESEVICQKDSEGNDYSPLAGIDNKAIYLAETTWHGTVYSLNWTAAQCCLDDEKWEEMKKGIPALILYPVN